MFKSIKQSEQDNGKQHSILLVDDDDVTRQILTFHLLQENYIVHEAINGKEALFAYNNHAPNLVLADIDMPEMDGVELTERIRESSPNIPVIVMSEEQQNLRLAEKKGADMTFLKPIHMPVILEMIGLLLIV